MHTAIALVTAFIFLRSVYKAVQWFYRRIRWGRSKRRQCAAAQELRSTTEPFGELVGNQAEQITTIIRLEAIGFTGGKDPFTPSDLSTNIYRIFNPIIERKAWLESNTATSVSHTLNGFELLMPSPGRILDPDTEFSEIHVIFYGDIAVAIRAPGHFDIFEEKRAPWRFARQISIIETPISTRYEATGGEESPRVEPKNSERVIRYMDDAHAILFNDQCVANGYMLITGTAGVISLMMALFLTSVISPLIPATLKSEIPWLPAVTAIAATWLTLILAFLVYEHFRFNKQKIVVFDRMRQKVYISQSRRSEPIVVRWNELQVNIHQHHLRAIGGEFAINHCHLQLQPHPTPPGTSVSFSMQAFSSGITVWQSLHSFMSRELHSIHGMDMGMLEYRTGDPPRDDIYLLKRRFKTTFREEDLFVQIGWSFLFFLTLGPLPYLLASRCSKWRVLQARQRTNGLSES
ncbi:hypothetical protein ACQUWM_05870 [Marinobacter sp. DUT-3]|uniref:hypothetical protein n=1 Tax=Marinobacter sp. DUT-3 TaxID=3412036 RepID=UPI003D17997D